MSAKDLDHGDPAVMRDLQRSCIMCDDKRRCKFDLINGVITDNFRDYCPNAFTLDALLQAKQERRRVRTTLKGGFRVDRSIICPRSGTNGDICSAIRC